MKRRVQPNALRAAVDTAEPVAYSAEQITVLEGLEPVRKRPGMYIGSTGPRGLHHLVYEVVDNSVDEALAGHATYIKVRLHSDGSVSVSDDGRGIPCDIHSKTGRPALETVLTVLHAGGKFGDSGYKVSAGLHGVGVSVVNALSSKLEISVRRDGMLHEMAFSQGKTTKEMLTSPLPPGSGSGTTVRFWPDHAIFKTVTFFDADALGKRFDEQAYLNAGLNITLEDERQPSSREEMAATDNADGKEASNEERRAPEVVRTRIFCHAGGIAEYVDHICEGKRPLFEDATTLQVSRTVKGIAVDVALRWNADMYSDSLYSFANGVHTAQGGTHLDGLKATLTRVLNAQARLSGKIKEKSPNLSGDFLREGLCAIISIKMQEAEFEGQTKNRLGSVEVRPIVSEVVADMLEDFAAKRPKDLAAIIDKASAAAKAAEAAKAARDLVRRKTVLGSSVLPGKLADCSNTDPATSEIFIVEGDSAGGSTKQGRQRSTQAVLPLRGKILNVEKADDAKMYANNEIQNLITGLGLGIKGEEFTPSQLRYHRIILMTDADVDGAHIRTLLLTFFYRFQRAVIEEGFVYIAYPPLYKVRSRGKVQYCYTEDELRLLTEQMGGKPSIQRFKGLGEMMPQELWATTMNPETRLLKKVTIEDAAQADRLITMLMGDVVLPRKQFIADRADTLDWEQLDV